MGDLTKNFSVIEFACRCGKCDWGDIHKIHPAFILPIAKQLQALRNYISQEEKKDVPLITHCGIRCQEHNKSIGGELQSRHLPEFYVKGQGAVDFHARGISISKLHGYVKKAWKLGIISGGCGLYEWGAHSDTSSRRFWGRFWGKP